MRIDVQCPSCFAGFNVRDEFAGKTVRCKACSGPVPVPDDVAPAIEPLSRSHSSFSSGTPRRSGKKSKSNNTNPGMAMGLVIGIGGTAVVGLVVAVATMSRGGSTPPVITPPAPMASTPSVAPVDAPVPSVVPTVAANVEPAKPASEPVAKATEEEKPVKNPVEPATLDLPDLIARVEPAVIKIEVTGEVNDSLGSGYVVHEDGTAVTNYHVIAGAKSATAKFPDGTKVKVAGYKLLKPRADIAIIKLELGGKRIDPVAIAQNLPRKGIDVVGFGAPEGLSFTTSTGIISGIRDPDVMAEELGEDLDGMWLQTTCPISHGSSGGPLTDRQGRVVAMNSKTHTTGQNLNFAVSGVDIAAAVAEAPSDVKPLRPEDLKDYESSIAAKGLPEEIGTPRGNQLLASLEEVTVIDPLAVITAIIDPKQVVTSRLLARSRSALQRRNIKVVTPGTKPEGRFGMLMVLLDFDDAVKGRSGTQTLIARSVLICRDPEATSKLGKMCIVWKGDEKLGTVAMAALIRGQIPKNFLFEDKVIKLFNRLETAHKTAQGEAGVPDSGVPEKKPTEKKSTEKPATKTPSKSAGF